MVLQSDTPSSVPGTPGPLSDTPSPVPGTPGPSSDTPGPLPGTSGPLSVLSDNAWYFWLFKWYFRPFKWCSPLSYAWYFSHFR